MRERLGMSCFHDRKSHLGAALPGFQIEIFMKNVSVQARFELHL